MHNPLKAVVVLVAALMLCGCNDGINVKVEERTYQTETGEAKLCVPEFSSDMSLDFIEKVNETYNKEVSALIDRFFAKKPDGDQKSKLGADTRIMRNDGRSVSVIFEGEAFTGGAHGEKFRIAKSFDFERGEEITLDKIFADASWKVVADNKMRKLTELGEGDYSQLWEIPSTELLKKENFYLKDDALVLYFPPYELSYYRRGYVEFEFKKEELAGYLSDYGREVL
ncbi:MAG: DUF3298 domain-containing protein [Clostridia bacterium]|nr:DUF3298 domain-containing protein [Clostridia bacterium]